MKALGLQERIESFVDQIEEAILTNMPEKGLKESECQRRYVLNRLNDFSKAVNGITDEDMIEED